MIFMDCNEKCPLKIEEECVKNPVRRGVGESDSPTDFIEDWGT